MGAGDEGVRAQRPVAAGRSRSARLTSSADFDRVYRRGRSSANRYLVVYAFPRGEPASQLRLGVSVGRRVGGAVERNRVKRLLREAFRAVAGELVEGHDFVLVARPDAGPLAREHGEQGIERALRDLVNEAGLVRAGQAA